MGCFFTCPEVKGGSAEPCQYVSNPVEAYCGDPLCFHSAASSIVLSPDPWRRNGWNEFTTPFDAVRHAMTLRAQVFQDVWMQESFPCSTQKLSLPRKHEGRCKPTVGFDENVELIIVLDGECKVNIQTSFTHGQLNDWVAKRGPCAEGMINMSPTPIALKGVIVRPQVAFSPMSLTSGVLLVTYGLLSHQSRRV